LRLRGVEQAEIPPDIPFKAICRVYDGGEDYVEVAVDRHVHKADKLWQWKLKLETVRPYIERAMKEAGSRELAVVMPRVRQWLSKEQTNLAAKILLHNI